MRVAMIGTGYVGLVSGACFSHFCHDVVCVYKDEGKVEFFEGNFTEYEDWKKKTYGAEAIQPKRIKYKRIAK